MTGGWKGLALHPRGHLLSGRAVGVHPARQDLLRAGLGAGADPDLLRHLRDHPGRGLPRGEPLWWVNLIIGILLAFWVSDSDRVYALAQRTFLILFWVGLMALFRDEVRLWH
jgi:hypothetical protein